MKYKILQVFTLCTLLGVNTLFAQEDGGFKRFSGAILFGNGIYLSEPIVPASPGANDWTVSGEAPYASGISSVNSITNMIGAEFRFFTSEKFAFKFNGSGIFRNTPARDNVPGVTPATSGAVDPASPNAGWIPNYSATVMDNSLNVNASVGGEFYFTGNTKISPYLGIMVPFCYGRRSVYDPTANVDMTKSTLDNAVTITDVGIRHIEQIGFGGQLVLGADYNLTDNLFLGLEIKPLSYLYAYNIKYPAPGLETRKADSHTYGFFTQPVLKIGIKF
jgi:opacity protein-like surface antigen